MPNLKFANEDHQLRRFRKAAELLGGQHAVARYLDVNVRHVRYLLSGERPLHDGILRDIAAALIKHAEECRELERTLSPAFVSNLTAKQAARQGKPDARRADQREDQPARAAKR